MSGFSIDQELLSSFVPLDSLSAESLAKLTERIRPQQASAGQTLFRLGETNQDAVYLLSGRVRLADKEGRAETISSGSAAARHPLANHQPRRCSAVADSEVRFIRIDNELLDILITWEQSAGYVVREISPEAELDDEGDWMIRTLQSSVFHHIPPANIQAVFNRMESVTVGKGQDVVVQGEEGDYYYILKQGRAEVLRRSDTGGKLVRLAEKRVGDGFGEEALISDTARNATVRMLVDGELMRLSKQDFEELLEAPVLEEVGREEAAPMVEREGATLVDVRLENEFAAGHMPGAINMPLYLLRLKSRGLSGNRPIIVYCDTGRRSSAAAFVLSERGFDVYVLKGGCEAEARHEVA